MKIITMRDLIPSNDERLRNLSDEVDMPISQENLELLQGMAAFIMQSQTKEVDENGDKYTSAVGLAAPQLGINKKMFVIAMPDDEGELFVYAVVNPLIEDRSKSMIALTEGESCLSLPDAEPEKVYRHSKIRWSGYLVNLTDGSYEFKKMSKLEGYLGIVFQHEYDHLRGILYTDISEGAIKNMMTMAEPSDPNLDTSGRLENPNSTTGGHLD